MNLYNRELSILSIDRNNYKRKLKFYLNQGKVMGGPTLKMTIEPTNFPYGHGQK
jgi:hypothetical protein